jgi:hypothetical protein
MLANKAQLTGLHPHAGGFIAWASQECWAAFRLLLVSFVVSFV